MDLVTCTSFMSRASGNCNNSWLFSFTLGCFSVVFLSGFVLPFFCHYFTYETASPASHPLASPELPLFGLNITTSQRQPTRTFLPKHISLVTLYRCLHTATATFLQLSYRGRHSPDRAITHYPGLFWQETYSPLSPAINLHLYLSDVWSFRHYPLRRSKERLLMFLPPEL